MNSKTDILVILPNNLGDIIMTTPVLEGLKARYPDSHITFFAEAGFEAGILNNPHIDEIIPFRRRLIKEYFTAGDWKAGSKECIDVIHRLNRTEYDLLINLSQHSYTANLLQLLHARSTAGCRFLREGNDSVPDAWSRYLYAIPFARRYNALHAVDVYRRIAKVTNHRGACTIQVTDREKQAAGTYLKSIGMDVAAGCIMVFQPGAAFPSKRWPAGHFIKLGRMLVEKGWQVLVSGAPAEKELADKVQRGIGNGSFSAAGQGDFRCAIANLAFAQGCVTGDTALMHAASALGVKTYALFGPTSPVETGPYGDGHFVFSGPCDQKPCFSERCTSMQCMNAILPETVFHCIEHQRVPLETNGDLYTTHIRENEDYYLASSDTTAFSYYNPVGAEITRCVFEENPRLHIPPSDAFEESRLESQEFIASVSRMENSLQAFIKNRDVQHIRAFEEAKNGLSALGGIGGFWSALLNIGLNSVPMLDPVDGVAQSAAVCAEIVSRIQRTFLSMQNPL